MAYVTAGDLDREIVLQTATKAQDADTGEEVITFTSETVWAQWLPAGSREAWQAGQRLQAQVAGVFRMYDRDPRPVPDGDQILFNGRVYDIAPYVEIGRGEGLDIPVIASGESQR